MDTDRFFHPDLAIFSVIIRFPGLKREMNGFRTARPSERQRSNRWFFFDFLMVSRSNAWTGHCANVHTLAEAKRLNCGHGRHGYTIQVGTCLAVQATKLPSIVCLCVKYSQISMIVCAVLILVKSC